MLHLYGRYGHRLMSSCNAISPSKTSEDEVNGELMENEFIYIYIRNEIRIQDKNDCYSELSLQQRATLKYAIEPILEYDI